ncbi:hypothetical protein [Paremcibacter congregatus]|nr:hypothetical protein [Paremcibacter congregatus]
MARLRRHKFIREEKQEATKTVRKRGADGKFIKEEENTDVQA